MFKSRVFLTSFLFILLCLSTTAFADTQTNSYELIGKDEHHHRRRGSRGYRGHRGHKGTRGINGAAGVAGSTGSTGATGATGAGIINTFITAAAHETPYSDQTILSGNAIVYDVVSNSSGNFSFAPPASVLTIPNSGDYEVTYGARWTSELTIEPILSLRVNGVEQPQSLITINSANKAWATISLMLNLSAGSTIEIFNNPANNSGNSLTLIDPYGFTTSAFITIKQLR
jgi:hypothetical protein